jgi:hypothetical protein
MEWADGTRYVGMFHGGRMGGGDGRMVYAFGHIYEGGMHRNKRHGFGKLLEQSGDSFEGEWWCDKRKKGMHVMNPKAPDREVYDGEFHAEGDPENRRGGKGKYYYSDGSVYDGDWHLGKRQGYGRFYVNGELVYDGGWFEDLRSGNGILREGGSKYEGSFEAGQFCGFGTMLYYDGTRFEGMWKDGLRHGEGKEISANGKSVFFGKYRHNLRIGQGRMEVIADEDKDRRIRIKVFGY